MRFLDPSVGRFTQVDPVGLGVNWYAYVASRPVLLIDPSGLWGTIDFVRHYGDGRGTTIDLGDVGLLDEYIARAELTTEGIERRMVAKGKELARTKCKGNHGSADISWKGHGREGYSATKGTENIFDPFFSLGSHNLWHRGKCSAHVDCCKRTISYKCGFDYGFYDPFEDPLCFHEIFGISWDPGFPYYITASWHTDIQGEERF